MKSEFLTFSQAAEFLNLCKSTLYKKTMNKELRFFKPAKKIFFKRSDLEAYILKGAVKSIDEIEQEAESYIEKNS